MIANYYNGEIILQSSYAEKDAIKTLSYRKWDPSMKVWRTTVNTLDEILEKFPGVYLAPDLVAFMNHRESVKKCSRSMKNSKEINLVGFGKGKEILPFQKAGLEFIEMTAGRAIIADEMGTGKTIQTLAYLQAHPELRPVIIVCPASVKFNWRNEINQWLTTEETIEVINKGSPDISKASIVVINYDILRKWVDTLLSINPLVVVFDESHMLKNTKATRTQAAIKLSQQVEHVIELTGTPILNKPVELFQQLNIVNPAAYPANSFFNFALKYCDAHQTRFGWDFTGASNIKGLAEEIKGFMIRRTKEEVIKELPPKRRTTVLLPMSNRKPYDKAFMEFKVWRATEHKPYWRNVLEWIETLKQHCTTGKLAAAKSWVKEFLETGNKLVLFCTHTHAVNEFMEEFSECAVKLDGSSTQKEREAAVYRFQNDPNVQLFVGNIKAAGIGITLTAASNVAFLELDWTPALHDQAEDRCNRMGQKSAVNCYYLLAENTIDTDIARMLESKREVVEDVMDDTKFLNFAFAL